MQISKAVQTEVFGKPLQNLDLVGDPGKNFAVIMKDGKIYKNTIH